MHIKENIAKGCKRILPHLRDVIVLQLSKSFFKLERDIVLIHTYISPEKPKVYEENESGTELYLKGNCMKFLKNALRKSTYYFQGDFKACTAREVDY